MPTATGKTQNRVLRVKHEIHCELDIPVVMLTHKPPFQCDGESCTARNNDKTVSMMGVEPPCDGGAAVGGARPTFLPQGRVSKPTVTALPET
ncbi:hypothetical protein Lalb_Chr19g0127971 [Lupinus albus]|uniref:Uncharacterized protein n=1 Tax=Lupinus albus TaxID=3870 RepID=A0A6A4NTG5_LUPAL|nr:hypothetical protein Lalb_Chr19g0127971 [Lupinus albus]